MKKQISALLAVLLLSLLATAVPQQGEKKENSYLVYIGSYTGPQSQGIYVYRFNPGARRATALGLAANTTNPSFLAVDPSQRFLFAVNETSDYEGQKSGAVSSFAIDHKSGKLKFLNQVPSRGAGPCHVSLDKTGRNLLVANYDSGSVAVFRVGLDGKLSEAVSVVQHTGHGVNPDRQEGPHAHFIEVSQDNQFAISADLGLDELLVYRFNAQTGALEPNRPAFAEVEPGAGPRHIAFDPSGKFLYVIDEMKSTINTFAWDEKHGVLQSLQTLSSRPDSSQGKNDAAEIAVHPSGKFLYASNRGDDTVGVFAINSTTHKLKPVEWVPTRGQAPRSFSIDPTGHYLFVANQKSDSIAIFRIDPATGRLIPEGAPWRVPVPVCVTFVAGR